MPSNYKIVRKQNDNLIFCEVNINCKIAMLNLKANKLGCLI